MDDLKKYFLTLFTFITLFLIVNTLKAQQTSNQRNKTASFLILDTYEKEIYDWWIRD